MRPISLTLKAFGSYPGEHTIDFDALGKKGLFLITGPTGSGKTTIFDAMVWALYGELPGMRKGKGSPRSHHVTDEDDETIVDFTFEAGNQRYRVNRTASKVVTKQRDAGTRLKSGNATVVRLDLNGVESMAVGADPTTTACQNIIGLEANQFQRVVLLPQGKFNEFLIGNKESREQLLKTLFGGELYEKAVEFIKKEMDRLDAEVGAIQQTIDHHRTNAITDLGTVTQHWEPTDTDGNPTVFPDSPDDVWLTECIAKFKLLGDIKNQEAKKLDDDATEAETRAANAKTEAERFDAAADLRSTIKTLETDRTDREADAEAVGASKRGRPVQTANGQRDEAQNELDRANASWDEVIRDVTAGFASLQEPLPVQLTALTVTARLQTLSSDIATKLGKIQESDEAEGKATEAESKHAAAVEKEESCRTAHDDAQARRDGLIIKIQALDPLADQVVALQGRVEAAKVRAKQRDQLDEKEHRELPAARLTEERTKSSAVEAGKRFVDTQGPRLANDLQAGEACPVCGSKDHPAPAHAPAGKAFEFADLKGAQEAYQAAATELAGIEATIQQLATTLGPDALRTVAQVREDLQRLEDELADAKTANATRSRHRGDLELAEKAFAKAAEELKLAQLATGSTRTAAGLARDAADTLAAAVLGYDVAALLAQKEKLVALGDIGKRLGIAESSVSTAKGALDNAESTLATALQASGFPEIAAALVAVLDPADETAREKRHTKWADDLRDANTRLDTLTKQGIPALRPDAEGLAEEARVARGHANDGIQIFTTANNALAAAATAMEDVENIGNASAGKRQALVTAQTVFLTCNGKAAGGVTLERWVLSGELQRVSDAANVHLARMSSGRYRIGRKEGTSSLELEVFDAHTGKARSPASLSGGEQFQASLSLALGMADVISQGGTGGGQQFEALFVDEGFGSLDAQALDDAISALEKIQSTGRMVGAITHVEAMKERLPVGILVEQNADGRGSRLRSNPAV